MATKGRTVQIKEYRFVKGARLAKIDPNVVGHHLTKLSGRTKTLTAQAVVDDAESNASPIHGLFEWDDSQAAREYRLTQARHLLRSVTVVFSNAGNTRLQEQEIRTFIHFPGKGDDEGRYVGTARVLGDSELRSGMVARAMAEAESWRERYQHLSELSTIFLAMERVAASLGDKSDAA